MSPETSLVAVDVQLAAADVDECPGAGAARVQGERCLTRLRESIRICETEAADASLPYMPLPILVYSDYV